MEDDYLPPYLHIDVHTGRLQTPIGFLWHIHTAPKPKSRPKNPITQLAKKGQLWQTNKSR